MLYLTSLISISLFGFPSGPEDASSDLNLKIRIIIYVYIYIYIYNDVFNDVPPTVDCLHSPVRSCNQQHSVAIERSPLYHKCYI